MHQDPQATMVIKVVGWPRTEYVTNARRVLLKALLEEHTSRQAMIAKEDRAVQ